MDRPHVRACRRGRAPRRDLLTAAGSGLAALALAAATPAAETDAGAWTTVGVTRTLAHGRSVALDAQARHKDDFSTLERFVLRPSLSWTGRDGARTTVGYDVHFIQSPRRLDEQRLWQQYQRAVRLGPAWSLTPGLRLEQRFIEGAGGITVRARPAIALTRTLPGDAWVALREEAHFNLTRAVDGPPRGFDQNRLFLVAGRRLAPALTAELGYHLQLLDRATDVLRHHVVLTVRLQLR